MSFVTCDSVDTTVEILGKYKLPKEDATVSGYELTSDAAGQCYFTEPSIWIVGRDRKTAQTGSVSLSAYTVGATDETLELSSNVLVTSSTTYSFQVLCDYTDEGGTSRTDTIFFFKPTAIISLIQDAAGAISFNGIPMHMRCKSGTTVTPYTTGTFTSVTYNIEYKLKKLN